MKLTFLGAAREVTGSCYYLEAAGKKLLIDCGMEQGQDVYENQPLPAGPGDIDAVLLTHAHIDHSGLLPLLQKQGLRCPVYATPSTIELCDIMLRDSAHIQEIEAEWKNRKAQRSGEKSVEPLYTTEDAEKLVALMRPIPYDTKRDIFPGLSVTMTDAGHLLGSASISLDIAEENERRTLVFSGDIGNLNQPIINNPVYPSRADFVVMESTYGDRLHGARPDYIADLADALQTTFDRGGNVVIPSFAVGRTQEILYFLREIKERRLIRGHDGFPVYMDSPLAIRATNIFTEADSRCFDDSMNALLRQGINPIQFADLKLRVTPDESKSINSEERPCVILSSSGMCEAGRIRHHLKHNLWKPQSTILFAGYQSTGTLGRQLVDGVKKVRLFGEDIEVRAEIRVLKAMSGHADRQGLDTWANAFSKTPVRYFITHGEESSALSFADLLQSQGKSAFVPYSGDGWDLLTDSLFAAGPRTKADSAPAAHRSLSEADRLLRQAFLRLEALVDSARGFSNVLKKKLAQQIDKLLDKWQ